MKGTTSVIPHKNNKTFKSINKHVHVCNKNRNPVGTGVASIAKNFLTTYAICLHVHANAKVVEATATKNCIKIEQNHMKVVSSKISTTNCALICSM